MLGLAHHTDRGGGVASMKREAQAQILDIRTPDLTVRKMIMSQEGTQTHDLANGLPFSNQLSYRVTRQLSG